MYGKEPKDISKPSSQAQTQERFHWYDLVCYNYAGNYEKKNNWDEMKSSRKKEQKVLVVVKNKNKRVDFDSESESSKISSSKSKEDKLQCLMADAESVVANDKVLDYSSDEFTRDSLVTALHDMVI